MKKFKFSLDTVLKYKEQVLEELKREHGFIIAAIVEKEAEIKILENNYHYRKEDFNNEKTKGMSVVDALSHEAHIHIIQHNIKIERERLKELYLKEAQKREEVVAAKTEVSSFEKLREKRIEEYEELVQKDEERFIEEFVANKSIAQYL